MLFSPKQPPTDCSQASRLAIGVHDWLSYETEEHRTSLEPIPTEEPTKATNSPPSVLSIQTLDLYFGGSVDGDGTDELEDALRQLVTQVREYVKINCVSLGRSSYHIYLALVLEELGIKFVIRALRAH